MVLKLNKIKTLSNIKDKIRNLNKEKREELNNLSLGEIKKIEKEATEELHNFLTEWSLKYPEIIRVSLYSVDGSLLSFRTDECNEIDIKLKFNLGIESI